MIVQLVADGGTEMSDEKAGRRHHRLHQHRVREDLGHHRRLQEHRRRTSPLRQIHPLGDRVMITPHNRKSRSRSGFFMSLKGTEADHRRGGCGVLGGEIECASRRECCSPSFPSGKVLSSNMEVLLPPSCGFHRAQTWNRVHVTRGMLLPLLPFGFPPPLGKSAILLKCGIYFSSFLIKFKYRIEIIERRTV